MQELRFFNIYLSKINPDDLSTRVVRFSIDDFKAIMELKSKIKIDYMKSVTNSLLRKVVNVPTERGGYTGFQLFKRCTVDADDSGEWFVEIDAHDEALPLMFEFKEKFFSYELWNALRLKSSNQLRMYEILKQYEKIGTRILSVKELKNLLGVDEAEYDRYERFKVRVLDACKQALAEHTDITFTYEPYGKRGKCGKILHLKFTIKKNDAHIDQITLSEFIQQQKNIIEDDSDLSVYDRKMLFLSDACDNEFTIAEIVVLYDKMSNSLPLETLKEDIKCYDYLLSKYRYMNMQNERRSISKRFGYMKSIIGTD